MAEDSFYTRLLKKAQIRERGIRPKTCRVSLNDLQEILFHFDRLDKIVREIEERNNEEKPKKPFYQGTCPNKDSKGLHWWFYRKNGTSYCNFCKADNPIVRKI